LTHSGHLTHEFRYGSTDQADSNAQILSIRQIGQRKAESSFPAFSCLAFSASPQEYVIHSPVSADDVAERGDVLATRVDVSFELATAGICSVEMVPRVDTTSDERRGLLLSVAVHDRRVVFGDVPLGEQLVGADVIRARRVGQKRPSKMAADAVLQHRVGATPELDAGDARTTSGPVEQHRDRSPSAAVAGRRRRVPLLGGEFDAVPRWMAAYLKARVADRHLHSYIGHVKIACSLSM